MHTKCSTRFQTRQAHIAVIGLGYVGLPLAVSFAQAIGFSSKDAKIGMLYLRDKKFIKQSLSAEIAREKVLNRAIKVTK